MEVAWDMGASLSCCYEAADEDIFKKYRYRSDSIDMPEDWAALRLPIHLELAALTSEDEIRKTIDSNGSVYLLSKDSKGRLPLHVACNISGTRYGGGSSQSHSVIKAVYQREPQAIRKGDSFNWYPLHHALANSSSFETVKMLLEAFPQAVKVLADGWHPLRLAIANKASTQSILAVLKADADASKVRSSSGSYHLHFSILHRTEEEVIKAVLVEFPEAARQKSGHGSLPLHLALQHDAPVGAVLAIIAAHPQGAATPDGDGSYALNLALANKFSHEVSDCAFVG